MQFWGLGWIVSSMSDLVLTPASLTRSPFPSYLSPPPSSFWLFSILLSSPFIYFFSPSSFYHFPIFSHGLTSHFPTHALVSGHRTPSATTCRCTPVLSACRTRAQARAPGGC